MKVILTTPTPHVLQNMPPKYAIQLGSIWHKSRLKWRDFYRKYGIRTLAFNLLSRVLKQVRSQKSALSFRIGPFPLQESLMPFWPAVSGDAPGTLRARRAWETPVEGRGIRATIAMERDQDLKQAHESQSCSSAEKELRANQRYSWLSSCLWKLRALEKTSFWYHPIVQKIAKATLHSSHIV